MQYYERLKEKILQIFSDLLKMELKNAVECHNESPRFLSGKMIGGIGPGQTVAVGLGKDLHTNRIFSLQILEIYL